MRTLSHTRIRRVCAAVVGAIVIATVAVNPTPASAASKDPIAVLATQVFFEVSAVSAATTPSVHVVLLARESRHKLAVAIARRTGVSATRLERAWALAPHEHQIAVYAALSQVGVKYKTYASRPGEALDCSALTQFAWKIAGYSIPRRAKMQGTSKTRVSKKKLRAGDLIVRDTHVYMYLGTDNLVVHAPYTGKVVRFRILPASRMSSSRFSNPTLISDWKTSSTSVKTSALSELGQQSR